MLLARLWRDKAMAYLLMGPVIVSKLAGFIFIATDQFVFQYSSRHKSPRL